MPPGLTPPQLDLRVPLPDLYGFGASASVVLLDSAPLAEGHPVPFCERLTDELLAQHAPYFADIRANPTELRLKFYLCITPTQAAGDRFCHVSLPSFLGALLAFLRAPRATVGRELALCQELWQETRESRWLLRIGHLHEGLGEVERAQMTYAAGARRYPGRPEFAALLGRVARSEKVGSVP
jgi:hypothetical protein